MQGDELGGICSNPCRTVVVAVRLGQSAVKWSFPCRSHFTGRKIISKKLGGLCKTVEPINDSTGPHLTF